MRRVLTSGLLGALPGALIIGASAILLSTGVITSDQSQFGFMGVPLLFFGLLIGMLIGAAASGSSLGVGVGMGCGLVVGVAMGPAFGPMFPGAWLLLGPMAILAGGAAGAWRHDHRTPPPAAQH